MATSLGLPTYAGSDSADIATKLNAITNGTDALFLSRSVPVTVRQVARTTTLTLATGANVVAAYDVGSLVNKGDIAYAGGVFTIGTAGAYYWSSGAAIPADSGAHYVSMYVQQNSAQSTYTEGANTQFTSTAITTTYINGGGPIVAAAGDTLRVVLYYSGTSLAGVAPKQFSLFRLS